MQTFQGTLYRALNVLWQGHPLSGEGARQHGGRFNPKGVPCLYTSTSANTALLEATQGAADIQPTTIVSYTADFQNVLDLSTRARVEDAGFDWAEFSDSQWRLMMLAAGTSGSQAIGLQASQDHDALLVPSFAPGAKLEDTNLVLYRWAATAPFKLLLNDIDDRLGLRASRST